MQVTHRRNVSRALPVLVVWAAMAAGNAAADEVRFETSRDGIIEALAYVDGTHVVDGDTYVVAGGAVHKVRPNGRRIRVRGLESVVQERVSPRVALPILFEHGSDVPTPEGTALIAELAAALRSPELSGSRFVIGGHTDSRGAGEYNLGISQRRADRVAAVLADTYGIDRSKLVAEGHGENRPAADNATTEGQRRNCRIEVVRLVEP